MPTVHCSQQAEAGSGGLPFSTLLFGPVQLFFHVSLRLLAQVSRQTAPPNIKILFDSLSV